MVTDQYSHIIDENRAHNAQLFEEAFYNRKEDTLQTNQPETEATEVDPELLNKVLHNPDLIALLQALGQKK